jgi:hypothetical protein
MMEAERTSETSIDNYFTRQYIPEDTSYSPPWELEISHKWCSVDEVQNVAQTGMVTAHEIIVQMSANRHQTPS